MWVIVEVRAAGVLGRAEAGLGRVCCSPWGWAFSRCLAEGQSLSARGAVAQIWSRLDMKVRPKPGSRVQLAQA